MCNSSKNLSCPNRNSVSPGNRPELPDRYPREREFSMKRNQSIHICDLREGCTVLGTTQPQAALLPSNLNPRNACLFRLLVAVADTSYSSSTTNCSACLNLLGGSCETAPRSHNVDESYHRKSTKGHHKRLRTGLNVDLLVRYDKADSLKIG